MLKLKKNTYLDLVAITLKLKLIFLASILSRLSIIQDAEHFHMEKEDH